MWGGKFLDLWDFLEIISTAQSEEKKVMATRKSKGGVQRDQ